MLSVYIYIVVKFQNNSHLDIWSVRSKENAVEERICVCERKRGGGGGA
jgi:hypothetical protein